MDIKGRKGKRKKEWKTKTPKARRMEMRFENTVERNVLLGCVTFWLSEEGDVIRRVSCCADKA